MRNRAGSVLWILGCFAGPACGGSSAGGGGPGGGNAGACTVTVRGDQASGVASSTLPCGFARDLTTIGPAVEYVVDIAILGTSTRQAGTPLMAPHLSALPKATLDVTAPDRSALPLATITEQDMMGSVGGAIVVFGYLESGTRAWFASPRTPTDPPNGSFSVALTAAEPTDSADCSSSVVLTSLYPVTGCYRIHGTAHAVLVPSPAPSNTAAGTITLDWVF